MKSVRTRFLCLSLLLLCVVASGGAQQTPMPPHTNDPRVGLKAGLHDAGQAARNMELVSTLPKPEGFFDPKAPGGTPTPPEQPEREPNATGGEANRSGREGGGSNAEAPGPESPAMRSLVAGLAFAN